MFAFSFLLAVFFVCVFFVFAFSFLLAAVFDFCFFPVCTPPEIPGQISVFFVFVLGSQIYGRKRPSDIINLGPLKGPQGLIVRPSRPISPSPLPFMALIRLN